MDRVIDQIKHLCYKPDEAKYDFLIDLFSSDYFKREFDFKKKISIRSPFPNEDWKADFIPMIMLDSFAIQHDLTTLTTEVMDRGGDYEPVKMLADRYLDKYEDLREYYSKYSYEDVSSCMFLYGGAIPENNPMIFETKPIIVMDYLSHKKQ